MSDFSDRPFVAGSLTGLRSFRVDQYGRLKASQIDVVWTPEENSARCLRAVMNPGLTFGTLSWTMVAGGRWLIPEPRLDQPKPKAEHRAGDLKCSCGFYAYFDNGANQYHTDGNLYGLVSGYGVVTVGSRGFRAEKSRLLALVIPPKKENARTDLVRRNYPDAPVFDRKRDALAAFPLTPPSTPTPTDDPEFWTREAL